ncbi:MAG: ribonuclease D [Planctomycetota bacterium]
MHYESITESRSLEDYCGLLRKAPWIAIDTEFVAEHTFRPVLCLVQVATSEGLAVIDGLTVSDLAPFWEVLVNPGHVTVVHAGRGEVEFCLSATGSPPEGLFDVQVAAGMAGMEFPAGYGTLVSRLLGEPSKKHETRTDWRKRPLSSRQVEYALQDVMHLDPLRRLLEERLESLGRRAWFAEEMQNWLAEIAHAASDERWRRVSGNSGLDARQLAVVRELFRWRDAEAQRRDQPARRVLRDDLIVELARRQSSDPKHIRALRGLERGDLTRHMPSLSAAIQRALDLDPEELPRRPPREQTAQLSVLGQFLFAALGSLCRRAQLAPALVGSPNDVRDWIGWREGALAREPKLARGWRKEFIGKLFDDLLSGRKVVRVADPRSESPLVIE